MLFHPRENSILINIPLNMSGLQSSLTHFFSLFFICYFVVRTCFLFRFVPEINSFFSVLQFCLVLCSSFAVLSFLGQNIAGLTLLYFLIMLAFVPGFCLLYLPPHMTANAISFVKSFLKGSGKSYIKFIPSNLYFFSHF